MTVDLASAVAHGETATVSYTKPTVQPLQGSGGGAEVAAFSGETVTNATPPAFLSATVNGTSLSVTFDGNLDANLAPSGDVFEVEATPPGPEGSRAIAGTGTASVSGSTVTVELASAVRHGETVTVSYAKPAAGNKLQDPQGGEVADFGGESATNATPPGFQSATVNGTSLSVTFDGNLDANVRPSGSTFSVRATPSGGGAARTIRGTGTASVSDATVTVTLASAVAHGETVTVGYAKPATGNRLQDSGGNEVANFSGGSATNATPPAFQSATVNGTSLSVTFDGNLDANVHPAGSAFTVRATPSGGAARTIAGTGTASVSGATVTVTLASAVAHGETVTVGYAKPTNNPLQDSGGREVANFSGGSVTNATPQPPSTPGTPAPSFRSASVNRTALTVTFDRSLTASSRPAGSAFTVRATPSGGAARTISGTGTASVSGATVTVALASAVAYGETVTVGYAKPSANRLRGSGGEVAAFSGRSAANRTPNPATTPPAPPGRGTLSGGGATVTLDFAEALDASSVPAPDDFTVTLAAASTSTAAGEPAADAHHRVTAVSIRGSSVVLTISPAVPAGRDVTVSYTKGANPLRTADGREVPDFNVAAAPPSPPPPPANRAPTFGVSEYAFDLEENLAGSLQPVELGVVSARDPDGDALTYALAEGDSLRFAVDSRDGALMYVGPGEDYETEPNLYELTVRASDPEGESAEAHVTVTVVNVVELPVAADDAVETDEDVAVEIDVLANDADAEGTGLRVASVTAAANGTAEIAASGAVLYTPDENWYGTDGFTYVLEDGNGATSEAAVEVTVAPVNDLPEAAADTASTDEDVPVEVAVLANDTDVDGDSLRVSSVTAPANGTAAIAAGGVRYTPNENWHGTDAFTYEVDDGNGGTAEASVEVTVAPVNDAPEAADDEASTLEDEAVEVDVLANDTDADGDGLRVSSVSAPSNGTAEVAAGGVRYTPAPDWHGTDSFTYEVDDGNGATATAAVTVTVVPVNDAPVAVGTIPDQSLEEQGEPARIELGPYFEDTDGDALDYVTVSSDSSVVVPSVAGSVLTLAPAGYGMAVVVVAARDPGGLMATQTLRVGVSDRAAREVVSHALAGLARSHLASVRMTLGRRATASRGESSRLSLLGRDVPLGADAAKSAAERMWSSWRSGVTSRAMSQAAPYAARGGMHGGMPGAGQPADDMTLGELFRFGDLVPRFKGGRDPLRGSEFQFAFGGGQEADGGGGLRFQLWGQGDVQTFQGAPSAASDYDGELQTGYVGVDTRLNDAWLLGVAVARSRGTGNWRAGGASGSLETRLVAVHPYLQWSSGATSLWATAGAGWGDADNVRDRGGRTEASGLGLRLGLVELRRRLAAGGGFELGLRADAGWAELATDIGSETLDSQAAAVNQLRLGAELSQQLRLGGLSLTPFGEAHVRRDGGAGQPGTGLELSGGLKAQAGILRIDAQGRLLAVHSAAGYEERGLGLTLSLGSPGGEGPSLSVAPRWGDLASGGDALWQEQLYSRYAPATATTADGAPAPSARNPWTLDLRGGYGLRIPGGRLLTWTGSLNHSATGPRFTAALKLGLGNASGAETGAEGTNGMVP